MFLRKNTGFFHCSGIELSKNGKQKLLEYNELINIINKDEEENVERWTYESIQQHRWSPNPYRKEKKLMFQLNGTDMKNQHGNQWKS